MIWKNRLLILTVLVFKIICLKAQKNWNFGLFAGPNISYLTNQQNTFNLIPPYRAFQSTKYPVEYMGGLFANSPYFGPSDKVLIKAELFINKTRDNITFTNDSIDFIKFNMKHVYIGFHIMSGWTNERISVFAGLGYGFNTNGSNIKIPEMKNFEKEVQEIVEGIDNLYIPIIISYKIGELPIDVQLRANIGIRDVMFVKSNGLNFSSSPKNLLHTFGISFSYQIPTE